MVDGEKLGWEIILFVLSMGIAITLTWASNNFFRPQFLTFDRIFESFLSFLVISLTLPAIYLVKDLEDSIRDKIDNEEDEKQLTKQIIKEEDVKVRSKLQMKRTIEFLFLFLIFVILIDLIGFSTYLIYSSMRNVVAGIGFAFVLYVMLFNR